MFVAGPWWLAAAASCAYKAEDRVILRERRHIARNLPTRDLPDFLQIHKTAPAAHDAGEVPALKPPPERRTRDSQGPDRLIDGYQIAGHTSIVSQ